MFKLKDNSLNEVSKELLSEVEKLEPGQVRTFQALWGVKVHDAENSNVFELAFGKRRIALKDKIYDPYKKDTIEIGIPESVENGMVKSFKMFSPGETEMKFGGRFSLAGDNIEHIEIFEFLMLSNILKNNKHRTSNEPPLLELLPVIEGMKPFTGNVPKVVSTKKELQPAL